MDSDPGPPVVMQVPDKRQTIVEISLKAGCRGMTRCQGELSRLLTEWRGASSGGVTLHGNMRWEDRGRGRIEVLG